MLSETVQQCCKAISSSLSDLPSFSAAMRSNERAAEPWLSAAVVMNASTSSIQLERGTRSKASDSERTPSRKTTKTPRRPLFAGADLVLRVVLSAPARPYHPAQPSQDIRPLLFRLSLGLPFYLASTSSWVV